MLCAWSTRQPPTGQEDLAPEEMLELLAGEQQPVTMRPGQPAPGLRHVRPAEHHGVGLAPWHAGHVEPGPHHRRLLRVPELLDVEVHDEMRDLADLA